VYNQDGDPLEQVDLIPREKIGRTLVEMYGGTLIEQTGADKTIGPNLEGNTENTGITDKSGQFVDAPLGISQGLPMKGAKVTQKIYFKIGKKKFFVRTNLFKITSSRDWKNNQYIYTISNGSDINKTVNLTIK
jgi:hypothetical protein